MYSSVTKDDEIDLKGIWKTLIKYKIIIFTCTVAALISSIIYVTTKTPVYRGKILIEVGTVIFNSEIANTKPTIIRPLDNLRDLKEILIQTIESKRFQEEIITLEFPKESSNLIQINCQSSNQQHIISTLKSISEIVLKRHQKIEAFYRNLNVEVYPSTFYEAIHIKLIHSKTGLIVTVAMISGLLLGIIFAFFLEFISTKRNR